MKKYALFSVTHGIMKINLINDWDNNALLISKCTINRLKSKQVVSAKSVVNSSLCHWNQEGTLIEERRDE
jgi:hypothetical protein